MEWLALHWETFRAFSLFVLFCVAVLYVLVNTDFADAHSTPAAKAVHPKLDQLLTDLEDAVRQLPESRVHWNHWRYADLLIMLGQAERELRELDDPDRRRYNTRFDNIIRMAASKGFDFHNPADRVFKYPGSALEDQPTDDLGEAQDAGPLVLGQGSKPPLSDARDEDLLDELSSLEENADELSINDFDTVFGSSDTTDLFCACEYEPSLSLDQCIDCSLFAPVDAACGSEILIQVFAHTSDKLDEAHARAQEHDEISCRRGFTTLDTSIEHDSVLTFDLSLAHATVDPSTQHLRWVGETRYVAFSARIADDARGSLIGKLIVSRAGLPIGRILFQVTASQAHRSAGAVNEQTGEALYFNQAFISYASDDRTEVLKRTQMLDKLGISYFHDLLTLDPGDRWAQDIYRHIDYADVFLLFWSSAARRSRWVRKELDYAIASKRGDDTSPPEIMPVIIEGPPPPPPPQGLEHLHFNDRFIYFMDRTG